MANKPALRDHRFRIMEGVLAWEGEIGNARVRKLFEIKPVQASRLLLGFRTFMGERIVEDSKGRVFKPADAKNFSTDVSLEEYIRWTQSGSSIENSILDVRADLTKVKPSVFSLLRRAALNRTGIVIAYASMKNPVLEERLVFPHSMVRVGRRWHVRAWCGERKEFRDFTLGRIRSVLHSPTKSEHPVEEDKKWNQIVQIRLVPHRKLSLEQQKVVRDELFSGTMGERISVRASLAHYMIQELRAATNPENEKPPEFQIEVANIEQLKGSLFIKD